MDSLFFYNSKIFASQFSQEHNIIDNAQVIASNNNPTILSLCIRSFLSNSKIAFIKIRLRDFDTTICYFAHYQLKLN